MSILGDYLREKLGLPFSKEALDRKINLYKLSEEKQVNFSMAERTILISEVNERIRQLEILINNNQKFIDLYHSIKTLSKEKVKQSDSPIKDKLYDQQGNLIITANYKTISDYINSLLKQGLDSSSILYFNQELAKILKKAWTYYVYCIIQGQGELKINGIYLDECYDIYSDYSKILSLIRAGYLKDEIGNIIIINDSNIKLIINSYRMAEQVNNNLAIVLQNFKNRLDILSSAQLSDEYILKVIKETRQLLKSSPEYFKAQASHEYLEQINKNR